ncbi:MAG: ZIP family metal transporter [Conexivisphaerales archaeon]
MLGAVAGLTIFLGLPIAILRNTDQKTKGFLNAIAIGILLFLIVDVFSHAWEIVEESASEWFAGKISMGIAASNLTAMLGGIAVGLLGLSYYESKFLLTNTDTNSKLRFRMEKVEKESNSYGLKVEELGAYKLATMIAIAIGAHNFSEGLAIGQSYAAGSISLAIMLVIGFGTHNATEGFGISSPLIRLERRPSAKFITGLGLVGGLPTFVGTVLGSLVGVSDFTYVLFLSVAGGALVYVSLLMYTTGRRYVQNHVIMLGVFVGLLAGFITDLLVTLGGV